MSVMAILQQFPTVGSLSALEIGLFSRFASDHTGSLYGLTWNGTIVEIGPPGVVTVTMPEVAPAGTVAAK